MGNIPLLIIPISLSIAHYIGLHKTINNHQITKPLRSFTAGFSISYVFLILIPEVFRLQMVTTLNTFVFTVLGFASFHVLLKYIFRQRNSKRKVMLLDEIHLFASGLYSFLLAFSIVELSKVQVGQGIILVILIIIHTTLSEISHKEISKHRNQNVKTLVLIIATIVGGMLPLLNIATSELSAVLYALAAGAIIYITTREELPEDDSGKPILFMFGVLVFIVASSFL
jgi:zinc transporter ZupT